MEPLNEVDSNQVISEPVFKKMKQNVPESSNKPSAGVSHQIASDGTALVSCDANYHQGASFGLNFVTYAEYMSLKSEHDKLQAEFHCIRNFLQENVTVNTISDIKILKEDNRRLKAEVDQLKKYLSEKVEAVKQIPVNTGGCTEERLASMEKQLINLHTSINHTPPVPNSETLNYLSEFVTFFTKPEKHCTAPAMTDEEATNATSMSTEVYTADKCAPTTGLAVTRDLAAGDNESTTQQMNQQHSHRHGNDDVTASSDNLNQLTPSHPAPEESPYSLKVQLLPKYNIWVNRSKLTALLQDSMLQTDNSPLYLLRKLIPMIFTWQELAFSRGQGICTKSRDELKSPLDPVKTNACKDFMRLFCSQNNLVEPVDTAINTQFTHTITYARTRMKRHLGKPNCKVSTLMSDYPNLSPVKNCDRLEYVGSGAEVEQIMLEQASYAADNTHNTQRLETVMRSLGEQGYVDEKYPAPKAEQTETISSQLEISENS